MGIDHLLELGLADGADTLPRGHGSADPHGRVDRIHVGVQGALAVAVLDHHGGAALLRQRTTARGEIAGDDGARALRFAGALFVADYLF